MFKQIGLELNIDEVQQEKLHMYLAPLVSYLKRTNEGFIINKSKKGRKAFRVPVPIELPDVHNIDVWIDFGEKKIKCRVLDISAEGVGLLPPFNDEKELFRSGGIYALEIRLGKEILTVNGTIKNITKAEPSRAQQHWLKKYYYKVRYPKS